MAPLPLPESRFRPPPPSPSIHKAAEAVFHQLQRLRILVYILLGTSAAVGVAFLIWKFGSLLRQFTLGRILEERKQVGTRYIKTWYAWIPQDEYNFRRQKWKNLYSTFRGWFSWDDSDEYSKIWWDSDCAGDQICSRRKVDSYRGRSKRAPSVNWKSKNIAADPVATEREILRASTAVNTYKLPPRPAPAHLTYPFHLKPINPIAVVDQNPAFLVPTNDIVLSGRFEPLIWAPGQASFESQMSVGRKSMRSMIRKTQQLRYLRNWATRLEMGSLESILPHQSGVLGRPGSPMIPDSSSGSGQQRDSHGISCSSIEQIRREPIESFSKTRADKQCEILDAERNFMDNLDRHLEWLFNECQPGQRGFKFPILPKNWINNQKWLVYINPCGASVETMRRYAQCEVGAGEYRPINCRMSAATVSCRRIRADSIESWRAAINRDRRHHNIAGVRSVEVFVSSEEDILDSVIDPADWILPRPPQGFEIRNRQKNAYYYDGIGRWAKLEEWQTIGEGRDYSADIWKKQMGVISRLEESKTEFRHNHAEIVCS